MTLPDISPLVDLVRDQRVVVLSGAGVSTESGIPDYRGPKTRKKARNPIQHRAFLDDPDARVRYWARSTVGWPTMAAAKPNDGHRALTRLEAAGVVQGVITQNVDRLHHAAGSERVVELHVATIARPSALRAEQARCCLDWPMHCWHRRGRQSRA